MVHVQNRNTVCGQRKEEILCQLRELAKLEPGIDQNKQDVEPSPGFQSLLPYDDFQHQNLNFESKTEPTFFATYEVYYLLLLFFILFFLPAYFRLILQFNINFSN